MAKTTADQEYQGKKKEVEIMLTKIGLALNTHAKRQATQKEYWGYVGDLEHTLEGLTQVNRFLRNEQE